MRPQGILRVLPMASLGKQNNHVSTFLQRFLSDTKRQLGEKLHRNREEQNATMIMQYVQSYRGCLCCAQCQPKKDVEAREAMWPQVFWLTGQLHVAQFTLVSCWKCYGDLLTRFNVLL